MRRGDVLPKYHLVQRKRKNGETVLYAGLLRPDGSRRYSQMLQLETAPSTIGVRDKQRRDKEAHAELLALYDAGKIGVSSDLDNYLLTFWDYEKSEYVRSRRAEGRNLSPVYCANSQALVRNYFLPYMDAHNVHTLADLTKQLCLQWRNHLYEKREEFGISSTTVNRCRQAAHGALEHATAMDLIPSNPMRFIRRVKEHPKQRTIFEKDELTKLFSAPWPDVRAFAGCVLAGATGLRFGEIRGLLLKNTFLIEGYLNVLTNWQDGQGLKPPKWNDVRYGVPLPKRAVDAINAMLEVHPYSPGPDSFVFFGDKVGQPLPWQILQRVLKAQLKTCNIPEKGRTFHSFRHTVASLLAGSAGMERLLGHTSLAMTEQYTHPTDDDRAVVLEAQNGLW